MQQVIPPGTTVVVLAQPAIQNKQELYRNMKHGFSRALVGLGGVQLCIGVLCIVFQCVSLGFYGTRTVYSFAFVGHGIWNGLLFLITGIFGIVGGYRKSRCMVVSFNVFSIISACFTTVLLGVATPSAIVVHCNQLLYNRYYYYDYYGSTTTSSTTTTTYRKCWDQMNVVIAMESMLAILAVIEGVVAIVSSAICCAIGACCCGCGGSCCCPKSPPPQPQFLALGEHSLQQQQFPNQWVLAGNQPHHQLNGQAPDAGYQRLYTTLENAEYRPVDSASSVAPKNNNSQYMDITYDPEQTTGIK